MTATDRKAISAPAPMHITVGICTWNRSALLQQTLEQMRRLAIPPGVTWELLVVNNNCTDDTSAVLERFRERLPLRALFEPTPGKSHALNRAVKEARGDYILWTDDDVLVGEQWLAAYCEAFRRWPDASLFGGPIRPWFAGTPPAWLERIVEKTEAASAFAILDLGTEPIAFNLRRNPYGANMAVKRADQLRFPYDPELGPRHGKYATGEEAAMIHDMLSSGLTGWWVPGAEVRHYLPAHRQSTRYLRKYFSGRGAFLAQQEIAGGEAMLFGKPRRLWLQFVQCELRYWMRRYLTPPEVWIGYLMEASIARGQLMTNGSREERKR